MDNINYSWESDNLNDLSDQDNIDNDKNTESSEKVEINLSTRKNLQLARRLFHMANGVGIATVYLISLTHQQMIHFLGTLLCLLYKNTLYW